MKRTGPYLSVEWFSYHHTRDGMTPTQGTYNKREITMSKAYLPKEIQDKLGYSFEKVTVNSNGHPRYVIHFMAFLTKKEMFEDYRGDIMKQYDLAKDRAKELGFSVYRAKSHGGCFVCTSWSLDTTAKEIIKLRYQYEGTVQ